jgi:hypothetical protein
LIAVKSAVEYVTVHSSPAGALAEEAVSVRFIVVVPPATAAAGERERLVCARAQPELASNATSRRIRAERGLTSAAFKLKISAVILISKKILSPIKN